VTHATQVAVLESLVGQHSEDSPEQLKGVPPLGGGVEVEGVSQSAAATHELSGLVLCAWLVSGQAECQVQSESVPCKCRTLFRESVSGLFWSAGRLQRGEGC